MRRTFSKGFGLMALLQIMGIMPGSGMASTNKPQKVSSAFSGPAGRFLNQRQKRKLAKQNPHSKKWDS